jgi:hypothetical protein
MNESGSVLVSLIFLAVVLALYFAPAWAAYCNHKTNTPAIFVLNLLLGWTFIGWVIAMVWAVTKDTERVST